MTHYQFQSLTRQEQYEQLWQQGTYLMPAYKGNNRFMLYQVDNFYVELTYDSMANELLNLRSFVSTAPLDRYLQRIDISECMQ